MPDKKKWVQPALVSLGTVEDLTQMPERRHRDGAPGKLGKDDARFLLVRDGDFLSS